jgi:hypothetical protein
MVTSSGRQRGTTPFTRGQLHYLLRNSVYIGRIRHKDRSYPGQHPAIIDQSLWDRVQATLVTARARPRGRSAAATGARPLTGKLRDETGDLLTPTHSQRHGRRFPYYVSHRLIAGGTDPAGWRLPAEALESALRAVMAGHLRRLAREHRLLDPPDARRAPDLARKVDLLVARINGDAAALGALIARGDLDAATVRIALDPQALAAALDLRSDDLAATAMTIVAPLTLARRGIETRIVAGDAEPVPDPNLIRVLAEARGWAKALRAGTGLAELAVRTGHSEAYLRTRLPLAFLCPDLQRAIVEGRQPPSLSVARLLREHIPLDWQEQHRRFGVA